METMTDELTVIPGIIGMVGGMDTLKPEFIEDVVIISEEQEKHPDFIESNTSGTTFEGPKRSCAIPSFSDNQLTTSRQTFVHRIEDATRSYFIGESIGSTEIKVPHKILGRASSALTKRKEELKSEDETIYYQRVAFCSYIRTMSRMVNGEEVHLCIGGIRSLNEENLYNRKSPEKFKAFIGWRACVCSNLMLTNDRLIGRLEVVSDTDTYSSVFRLFRDFNPEHNLRPLENLRRTKISQKQLCRIIGRLRLYQVLPVSQPRELPKVILGDSNTSATTKNYVDSPSFGLRGRENISCWDLIQLLNDAAKQSYIDKFLGRNRNCIDFVVGTQKALNGEDTEDHGWFLSQTGKQINSQGRKI